MNKQLDVAATPTCGRTELERFRNLPCVEQAIDRPLADSEQVADLGNVERKWIDDGISNSWHELLLRMGVRARGY